MEPGLPSCSGTYNGSNCLFDASITTAGGIDFWRMIYHILVRDSSDVDIVCGTGTRLQEHQRYTTECALTRLCVTWYCHMVIT